MKLTTLCYIEHNEKYLMLHRVKKENDVNKDKWIGIGGKFEFGESPEECLIREAQEEIGITLTDYKLRGVITFIFNDEEAEYMFLYTAKENIKNLPECDEGILEWVSKNEIEKLNIWQGDKIFLKLLAEKKPFFSLKLKYHWDNLVSAVLDGNILPI